LFSSSIPHFSFILSLRIVTMKAQQPYLHVLSKMNSRSKPCI
jgi:hypothetical protein